MEERKSPCGLSELEWMEALHIHFINNDALRRTVGAVMVLCELHALSSFQPKRMINFTSSREK